MTNKLYLLVTCVFMFFFNCEESTKTTFSEISISTENNTIVEINIPKANGNNGIIDSINSSIEKAVISALHIGEPNNIESQTIKESITAFNKEHENFKTDFPESPQIWEVQVDGEVLYESSEITSISITSYINTGGAHGVLNISFLNFDNVTGQRISNEKLLKDIKAFKKVAKKYFDKSLKEKDILFESENFELPENIGFTEEGIILLYNIFQTQPYSPEIIEFTIPFDEVENYLVFNSTY